MLNPFFTTAFQRLSPRFLKPKRCCDCFFDTFVGSESGDDKPAEKTKKKKGKDADRFFKNPKPVYFFYCTPCCIARIKIVTVGVSLGTGVVSELDKLVDEAAAAAAAKKDKKKKKDKEEKKDKEKSGGKAAAAKEEDSDSDWAGE